MGRKRRGRCFGCQEGQCEGPEVSQHLLPPCLGGRRLAMSGERGPTPLLAPCGWWAPYCTALMQGQRFTSHQGAGGGGHGERRGLTQRQEGSSKLVVGFGGRECPVCLLPGLCAPALTTPFLALRHSMSHSFGESYRVGSTSGAHAITIFCSWDHKVTQKWASRLQHDNIRTRLKVSRPGSLAPVPLTPSPQNTSLACSAPAYPAWGLLVTKQPEPYCP